MEIIIDENLYKNKESKEDYKNKIIKEIFSQLPAPKGTGL